MSITSYGSCAGASAPAHPAYLQQAPAQHWHHPNGAHHPGNAALMNSHNGWTAPQNGGMHGGSNRVAWHDGRPMQMPPPGGWDASNHPLSESFSRHILCCLSRTALLHNLLVWVTQNVVK